MKHHFKSSELPHIWANLTPEEIEAGRSGRCPSSETFQGTDYKSYWAVIGRHVTSRGKHGFVVSRKSYSVTTSSHESALLDAVRGHENVFVVGEQWADITPQEVYADIRARIDTVLLKASRSRVHGGGYLDQAKELVAQLQRANEFFGLRRKPYDPDISALVAEHKEKTRQAKERKAKEDARRAKLVARYAPELVQLWRAHGETEERWAKIGEESKAAGLRTISFADLIPWGNSLLRLNEDKTRVETNKGAQVLVRTVRFLWEFCCMARNSSCAIPAETVSRFPRLDSYSATSIDAQGNLVAGCHEIAFAEIEGIARELNLPPFNGQPMNAPRIPVAEVAP